MNTQDDVGSGEARFDLFIHKCIEVDDLSGTELGLTAMGNKRQFPFLHEGYVLEWKQIIRKSAPSLKSKTEPAM